MLPIKLASMARETDMAGAPNCLEQTQLLVHEVAATMTEAEDLALSG
jgi:hypothetical protein